MGLEGDRCARGGQGDCEVVTAPSTPRPATALWLLFAFPCVIWGTAGLPSHFLNVAPPSVEKAISCVVTGPPAVKSETIGGDCDRHGIQFS